MKIVVSGGWSYGNIGDEAIATATEYLLKRQFPNTELIFTSYDPEAFEACHGIPALPSVHRALAALPEETLCYDAVLADPEGFGISHFSRLMDEQTLFIMSGGGYFTESWKSQFVARLAEMAIAQSRGAKVCVIGQSIGPVFSQTGRQQLARLLNSCHFLSVRDRSTQEFLQSLELTLPVRLSPDVANVIADIIPPQPREPLVNIMPASFSGYVSVTQARERSPLLAKLRKRLSPAGIRYKLQMRKLVRMLSRQYPIQFVLSTHWSWDRNFVDYLCRRLDPDRFRIIVSENTRHLCDSLSCGQYLISTKMHPIILSASYGISAVAIAYNFKVDDYMASLGASDRCFRIDRVNAKQMLAALTAAEAVDASALKAQVYAMMEALAENLESDT